MRFLFLSLWWRWRNWLPVAQWVHKLEPGYDKNGKLIELFKNKD